MGSLGRSSAFLPLLVTIGCSLLLCCMLSQQVLAAAGTNPQLSFEGKVANSNGTNIPDGTYNMEFKVYQDGTSAGVGSTLKWTEDRLVGGTPVTITGGTFQVNLGSVTPFGASVDWNQDTLWLSMQVGNTSSCTITTTFLANCSGDGEMTPFIRLTSTPYAFNSDKLDGIDSSGLIQIGPGSVQTDASTNAGIFLNKTGSSGNILQLQKGGSDVLVISNTGGAAITGASSITGGNFAVNQTGTGAAVIINRTDGVASSLKSGLTKSTFVFDTSGTFSIAGDTRANILSGTSPGTDALTISSTGAVGIPNILSVTASAAPTVDQVTISNSGQGTSTTNVDGLAVTYETAGTTASADNAGLRVDVTSNNSGATTTLEGLKIGNLTSAEANSTETGLYVGTGWDVGLNLQSGGIQLLAQSDPAAPAADNLRVYAKKVAGRPMLKTIGPAGVDTPLQNAIWQNNTVMWTPGAAAGVWQGTVGSALGTPVIVLPTTTNFYTQERRSQWPTVAVTTNQQVGIRTEAMFFRGNTAGSGGFFAAFHFGLNTWTAGDRLFVGFSTGTTAVVTGNPSSLLNIAGFGIDAGDTALTFMHNDGSGTATKDAIAGQPTLATNQGYDAYIYMKPNDSTIYYRIDDTNAAVTIIDTSTSTDIVTANTMLLVHAAMSNGANTGAGAAQIGVNRIYVETDR